MDLEQVFDLPTALAQTEVQFDDKQQEAIDACCNVDKRIVAVTGEGGTGKTFIIKEVEKRLRDAGYIVGVSAPTGKAAVRVRESTGIGAMTNHRMLGYGQPLEHEETDEKTGDKKIVKISTGPSFDRRRPFPYDFIICDEYSMVNREIHDNLIAALKPGARIRMFGDTNQLKPIETNRELEKLPSAFQTALTKFTGVVLETNYRQQAGSGIITNAKRLLLGRTPQRADDFNMIVTDDPVIRLCKYVEEERANGIDYSTPEHQIITCMNKSWIGTKKLNLTLQSLFWDRQAPMMELPRHKWEEGDTTVRVQIGTKVVYTTNTYDLGNEQAVFNGEVGTVVNIDEHEGSLDVDFGDRVVTIPPVLIVITERGDVHETDPRKNLDLAYAITTHKMQGSEVRHVTYILNKSTIYGQSRRNAYTATTRAREKCTWITDQHSLKKSTVWAG